MLAEAARHASIVAISHAHARSFGDIPVAAVIHHGIDLDAYKPGPGDGGYLPFIGRMSPDMGVHHAVRVARRALARLTSPTCSRSKPGSRSRPPRSRPPPRTRR